MSVEEELRVTLFERVGRQLARTDSGRALAEHTQQMQRAAAAFQLAATGQSDDLQGTVVVSASDAIAFYVLPPILKHAREGLGITPIMHEIARDMPDVIEVLNEVPPIRFPIWLVTHRELQTSRRIRIVFDLLCEGLQ